MSIRNTTGMNVALLEQTKCTIFLHSVEMSQKAHELQVEKKDLQTLVVELLEDMDKDDAPHYPYAATFENNAFDPILILHSSGSTGEKRLQVRYIPQS